MEWYYANADQQMGPVAEEELERLAQTGVIQPDTLVWRSGMANWQPYREVKPAPLPATPPAGPPPVMGGGGIVCSECGKSFPADNVIRYGTQWVCANCKPIFVQRFKEGARLPGVLDYAGFWVRFAAKFVDNFIIAVILVLPLLIFGAVLGKSETAMSLVPLVNLGSIGVGVIYSTFFLGRYGATPGKMLCKLKVVTPEGRGISYGQALGRSLAEILSRLICLIGYIMAGFDDEKRALHDRMCNTRVVTV